MSLENIVFLRTWNGIAILYNKYQHCVIRHESFPLSSIFSLFWAKYFKRKCQTARTWRCMGTV